MDSTRCSADALCREISGELVDITSWLSEGELTPDQFRHTVSALEARKLQRHGFRLTTAVGEAGIVHFSLRFAGNDELCASLDIDPRSGRFTIQRACN